MIEANPRASRTVPFVSKAIGAPIAKIACRLMLGERARRPATCRRCRRGHVSRQGGGAALLALRAAPTRVLGPEMKSDRRGDGRRRRLPDRVRQGADRRRRRPPRRAGTVFITVTDSDKPAATQLATRFCDLGFRIVATGGTAQAISRMGVPVETINKIDEGSPNVVDYIQRGEVDLVINTPTGSGARTDGYEIRSAATRHGIPCVTTMTGASAAARAIGAQRERRRDRGPEPPGAPRGAPRAGVDGA